MVILSQAERDPPHTAWQRSR